MGRRFSIAVAVATLGVCALGVPAAQAAPPTWDVPSHDYGSQNVGSTTSRTFTLTAFCTTLDIMTFTCADPPGGVHVFGTPTVSGDGYALGTPNTCATGTLFTPTVGSMSCQTTVTFTPASAGVKPGSLDTASGPDIALTGTGVAGPAPTPAKKKKKCKKKKKATGGAAAAKKKCKKKK